jgi:hypothetical protein
MNSDELCEEIGDSRTAGDVNVNPITVSQIKHGCHPAQDLAGKPNIASPNI